MTTTKRNDPSPTVMALAAALQAVIAAAVAEALAAPPRPTRPVPWTPRTRPTMADVIGYRVWHQKAKGGWMTFGVTHDDMRRQAAYALAVTGVVHATRKAAVAEAHALSAKTGLPVLGTAR